MKGKKVLVAIGWLPSKDFSVRGATKMFPKRMIDAYKFIGCRPVKVRITIEEIK